MPVIRNREYLEILDDLEEEIAGACENLRLREYPNPTGVRAFVDAAAARIGIGALRHFRCAVGEIRAGWEREGGVHIRAVWDAATDLAFILASRDQATRHADRGRRSREYLAMCLLRAPTLAESVEKRSAELKPALLAQFSAIEKEFKGSSALNLHQHWSGLSKAEVRKIAGPKLDELAGEAMFDAVKRTTYVATSLLGHSDPGMDLFIPTDSKGRPSAEPDTDLTTTNPLSATAVGLLLLLALSGRVDKSVTDGARAIMQRVKLMERVGE